MSSIYNSKFSFGNRYHIFFLGLLIIAGLIIRLWIFPYDLPVTEDASVYFWYAMDMSITNSFPENYNFPNNGWPSFLSIIFDVAKFDDYIDYMNTQRITTIVISLITIVSVYHLCSNFFNKNYSLIGAAIFAFEPRLILDSLLGTNMIPFILLFTLSLSFFLSKNHKMILLSFVFASFATLVRYEGLLLLIPLSIIYLIRFRKDRQIILRYLLIITIFVLILTPMAYFRYQTNGNDGITSHIISGLEFFIGHESNVDTFSKNNILGSDTTKNRNFSGYMDEVIIWNKPLSDLDVTQLYNNGNPSLEKINLHDGLTVYFPFDKISENLELNNSEFFIQSNCTGITSNSCKILESNTSTFELTSGIKGSAIKFDRIDFLKFDDQAFPFSNSPRSISMWVLPTSSSEYGNLLYHSGVYQNEKIFEINTNLWETGSISVGILSDDIYSNPKVLNQNQWNHIVVTFNGDRLFSTETVKIYHNGVLLETNSASEGILLNDHNEVEINTTSYFGFDLFGKYFAWISFPIFFLFLPYGLIRLFRERGYEKYSVLLFGLILALPAFYAYFREFQEIKYLFYLFPIFALLSLFSIRKISEMIQKPTLLCILILVAIIISSIAFIDLKKIDNEFEKEAFEITRIVLEKASGINESTYHISKYSATAESFLQPNILPQQKTFTLQRLSPYSSDGIIDFVMNSRHSGLTHIVIDETTEPDFLREIFYDETKYKFLKKEFDSINHGYKYHVKIFKIDYSKVPFL